MFQTIQCSNLVKTFPITSVSQLRNKKEASPLADQAKLKNFIIDKNIII